MNKFVFTCGDINGIGPEIVVKTINKIFRQSNDKFLFICPGNVFNKTIQKIKPAFEFEKLKKYDKSSPYPVIIIDIGNYKIDPGMPTVHSGKASFEAIRLSFKLASQKKVDAIITAPISKTAIRSAGINFPGHTEMLAGWSSVKNYVMTFLSKRMNAGLLSIHEPLRRVPKFLTKTKLRENIKVVIKCLERDLNLKNPKIAILGLNPHAGEEGLIGNEEEKIIKPVIREFESPAIDGPFPSDAFFATRKYRYYNFVLGMYHDQVLIPFKMLNFSSGVNYTAGLNIIRTSPDHGVAYDIVGKNIADESSMIEAYRYAKKILKNRKRYESLSKK
jgi:4-hydroxythreonine-4-phosphate dehydrogenase